MCLYISQLICTWYDTIGPCQNMHRNAPGGQILNFQNIFDRACDDIKMYNVDTDRKFLQNHNLNEIMHQNALGVKF